MSDETEESSLREDVKFWIPVAFLAVLIVTLMISIQAVIGIGTLANDQHEGNLAACASGNLARVGNIQNLQADINNLEADRAFIRQLADSVPGEADLDAFIAAKDDAIESKRDAIRNQVDSIRPYEIHAGSPIKDCARAYPG